MSPEQFCYWLQGFAELNGRVPTEAEWVSIKEHLRTVFNKVTPPLMRLNESTPKVEIDKFKYFNPPVC